MTPISAASETKPDGQAQEEEEQQQQQGKHALMVKENSAAIKIQTAFRGYLARKALRALKGIVKLQAIIRGRAVRRQTMSTLKCLQSIVNIQSQACARRRLRMVEERCEYCNKNSSRYKTIRMDSNCERKWNNNVLLKEEVDTSISKKEASLRRERMKQYSYNHRMSAETERDRVNGKWRYWLEQWVDTQLSKSKELEDLDFRPHYSSICEEENGRRRTLNKLIRSIERENQIEGSMCQCQSHRRQCCSESVPSSPVVKPTYMAATESAKAKAIRTTNSPRIRTSWNLDTTNTISSDHHTYSPCKKKSSSSSSSYVNTNNGGGNYYQQTSPTLKHLSSKTRLA